MKARGPCTEETRQKHRLSKLGRRHSLDHRAALASGVRNWYADPISRRRGVLRVMSDREIADYRTLRGRGQFSQAEALMMVGRGDLLSYRPTPMPPRSIYRRLSPTERLAFWRVWDKANDWVQGLELIGRFDLIA